MTGSDNACNRPRQALTTEVSNVGPFVSLWTLGVAAETVVFLIGVVAAARNTDLIGGLFATVQVSQMVVSVVFPCALLMIARRLPPSIGLRSWAWLVFALSAFVWLTYDVSGLYRLAPLSLRSGSLHPLSSIVSVGWWLRSAEVLATVVLLDRLLTVHGKQLPAGIVPFLIIVLALKPLVRMLVPGDAGVGMVVGYAFPILQRLTAIAVGVVVTFRLSKPSTSPS